MNQELLDIISSTPALSGVDDIFYIDRDDIPLDKVQAIKSILRTSKSQGTLIEASKILSAWGFNDGVKFIDDFLNKKSKLNFNYFPHRIYGYDQSYEFILESLICYCARMEDISVQSGLDARTEILPSIKKIIALSSELPFSIQQLLAQVEKYGWDEYIPDLKIHFISINNNNNIDKSIEKFKILDCANVLMKKEKDFAEKVLLEFGVEYYLNS